MTKQELKNLTGIDPDKCIQNPYLGHEYGSLQPVDGWAPGQEIRNDGHGKYVIVTQYKEARTSKESHLNLQTKLPHHNDVENHPSQTDESKSQSSCNQQTLNQKVNL